MLVRIGHVRDGYSSHAIPSGPADGLLITGAVSQNMKLALRKTDDAIPAAKIVIAVGACASEAARSSATRR
jgi:Ni,Fe-hydrogenase III small subunit